MVVNYAALFMRFKLTPSTTADNCSQLSDAKVSSACVIQSATILSIILSISSLNLLGAACIAAIKITERVLLRLKLLKVSFLFFRFDFSILIELMEIDHFILVCEACLQSKVGPSLINDSSSRA